MSDIIHVKHNEGKQLLIIDHVLQEKLTSSHTCNAYAVGEIRVPPRAGPPLHHHEAQETFYVLEGSFEFRTLREGTPVTLVAEKGDIVHVPSHVPHTFSNVGLHEGRILGWLAPAGMEGFFDKIGVSYHGQKIEARKPGLWQMLKAGMWAKKFGISFVKEPRTNRS